MATKCEFYGNGSLVVHLDVSTCPTVFVTVADNVNAPEGAEPLALEIGARFYGAGVAGLVVGPGRDALTLAPYANTVAYVGPQGEIVYFHGLGLYPILMEVGRPGGSTITLRRLDPFDLIQFNHEGVLPPAYDDQDDR